jgi:uncharacterized protein
MRFLILTAWLFISITANAQTFPALTGRVIDNAQMIDPITRTALEQKLQTYYLKSTDQVVIATINSLEGYEMADYANRLFRHWQLGQKGKNNGVLLLISKGDRKVRIEVGRGLEGILTDALSKYIIQGAIVPKFKAGDPSAGISLAIDSIISVLSGDAEELKRRSVRPDKSDEFDITTLIPIIIFIIIVIIMLRNMKSAHLRRNNPYAPSNNWVVLPTPSSNWGGGGFSSGDSGFSGGGGDSGGGGASGSW